MHIPCKCGICRQDVSEPPLLTSEEVGNRYVLGGEAVCHFNRLEHERKFISNFGGLINHQGE